ncbi:glycerate kinase [Shouchella xiaoxiensis]|uniref:glycerate kinase n=1 Tax=Shouchella xiaoxiensis TaxID=766895 RepID=UPI00195C5AC4
MAFAGQLGHGHESIYNHGIDAAFSIVPGAIPLTEALDNASDFLTTTAEQIAKLYKMS